MNMHIQSLQHQEYYEDFICDIVLSAIFLLYAKLEEEHGLARHAMAVYDRATQAVLPEEQNEVKLHDFHCIT